MSRRRVNRADFRHLRPSGPGAWINAGRRPAAPSATLQQFSDQLQNLQGQPASVATVYPGSIESVEESQEPIPMPTAEELTNAGMSTPENQNLVNANLEREYGGGMSAAELQDFDKLITRLEASKLRQNAQANRARQREEYSTGLARMMRNA